MSFRLVSKLTTLVDSELTLNEHYALCYSTHMFFGARHENMSEGGLILSATEM